MSHACGLCGSELVVGRFVVCPRECTEVLCRACALKAVALEGFLWFCIVSMVSMVSYGFYGLLRFLTVSMVAVVCMVVRVSMFAVLFQLYACQGFVACMALMVLTSFHCFCCFYCFYGLWFLDLHSIISLKVFIDRHPGQQFPKCPWCRRALSAARWARYSRG